jgi:LemA protein
MAPVIIFTAFVLIVSVAWLIGTYNRFIKYKNRIEEAWSGIDVALKRRFNLIPKGNIWEIEIGDYINEPG